MSQANDDPMLSVCRQAFVQLKPEIEAVDEESFIQIAIDIPSAAITAQGAYARVIALRPLFVDWLPKLNIALVDKLELYALAMFCAHIDFRATREPPAELEALIGAAIAKRAILLADVNTLITYGLLSPAVTSSLLGINGYKNVMTDLGTLASILRTNAIKIAPRTTVKPDELKEAEDLAITLGKTVGLRQLSPQVIAQATRNRKAAFTLFRKAYEEVRLAVQYLRRYDGDADTIMPSLFAGRGGRKKSTDSSTKLNPPVPLPTLVNPQTLTSSGNSGTASAQLMSNEHGPFV